MEIKKRDCSVEKYSRNKIEKAIVSVFNALETEIEVIQLNEILDKIEKIILSKDSIDVESIQDIVEEKLMEYKYFKEAKAYIIYRKQHEENREVLKKFDLIIKDADLVPILKEIQKDFQMEEYSLELLYQKFLSLVKEGMNNEDHIDMLIKASVELVNQNAPKWEFIGARFLSYKINSFIDARMNKENIINFYDKLVYLTNHNYYGSYILENYDREEVLELEKYLDSQRDKLFTYSGLELVYKRYLIRTNDHIVLEKVQEMFMGIAMHLALPEKANKVSWAKKIYDILSTLKVTMATPTMSNARKPFHQLSSCFIDTVDDSLDGIYKSITNFSQVSKFGGGMGLYFGKVRAIGSDIRGFQGAAGGVVRWLKLVNDTAVAVDQLGMRQGAAAVYLDAWHKDLPEFLSIRTNNGDDRMKAHDIFPGVCYPDLFWKMVRENLNNDWYLMCPHEIKSIMGYSLEDYFGDEWEERYWQCVNDDRISKRKMKIKDIVRLILKSAVETGTPFAFNRDHVNKANPNSHKGIIYCSNLCTEIAQNMSSIEIMKPEIVEINGEEIVVEKSKPGDFVVCNLASLMLGKIDVNNKEELKYVITTIVRALDNVIDLNYYPIPYAKITNQKYRPIGLGTSGYHHMLVKNGIRFESNEHLTFVDELYEDINYFAIQASMEIAKEKGRYKYFENSEWHTKEYFSKRNYTSKRWQELACEVEKNGMRNGYLLAVAPTSSTSIIAGTSAAIDPIMNKFFLEEKKGSILTRVAPDLNKKTFWLYKSAHTIDQKWVVEAAGIRQRHIDQAQSLNLYVTNDYKMSELLELYISAWEYDVKTIYYVRSKSLEVEECESCAS